MSLKDYESEGSAIRRIMGKESLWDNIHKKRARIKAGSGEKMRKKGDKGAPTPAQMKRAQEEHEESEKNINITEEDIKISYSLLYVATYVFLTFARSELKRRVCLPGSCVCTGYQYSF